MKIALAQTNSTIGDLAGNAAKHLEYARRAAALGAELVVFHELSICGYPPRDLVERPDFVARCQQEAEALGRAAADLPLAMVVGLPATAPARRGKSLTNDAIVLHQGREIFRQSKMLLPTYDVFDESRYFLPADAQKLLAFGGHTIALTICEDAWNNLRYWEHPLYDRDPVDELVRGGAELLISINGSPWQMNKRSQRREMFAATTRQYGVPALYLNEVGGNDQLVFDGSSFAMDREGQVFASCASFAEDLVIADFTSFNGELHDTHAEEEEAVYEALVLGTRDYVRKCGFSKVIIGLSGGIDSALVACIATEAVGRENVLGVGMPGPYSSDHSVHDARSLAEGLGIRFELSNITAAWKQMVETLTPLFAGQPADVTEENMQARLRGVTLMALSNKSGALVLTTGNKSELAVGYCTLYGDMCGGLAVISDVPKTLVYRLCRIANRRLQKAIPENTFAKPPSAELRPDQKDSDSLPEYDILDRILKGYVEDFHSVADIAEEEGLDLALVKEIARKVDVNEYKRQQAAPGLKVTSKAFGTGRRMPLAQRYRS
jgi:NAD+ synthase (glutamine-hydrolysing)